MKLPKIPDGASWEEVERIVEKTCLTERDKKKYEVTTDLDTALIKHIYTDNSQKTKAKVSNLFLLVPYENLESDTYAIPIGKYTGKQLQDIPLKELNSYLAWIDNKDRITSPFLELKKKILVYLNN